MVRLAFMMLMVKRLVVGTATKKSQVLNGQVPVSRLIARWKGLCTINRYSRGGPL